MLYVLAFDEDTAFTAGLPTRALSIGFSLLTGLAISVVMPIAGALLVSAILIMPAAIAMRSMKTFNGVLLFAGALGLIGMLSGLALSFYWGTPPGATIAMLFVLAFVVQAVLLKIRGRH